MQRQGSNLPHRARPKVTRRSHSCCMQATPSANCAQRRTTMQLTAHKITPCLWFDTQAEDAARLYVSIFKDSRIRRTSRYGKEGHEIHGRPAGSIMTVEFEINGQTFVALN